MDSHAVIFNISSSWLLWRSVAKSRAPARTARTHARLHLQPRGHLVETSTALHHTAAHKPLSLPCCNAPLALHRVVLALLDHEGKATDPAVALLLGLGLQVHRALARVDGEAQVLVGALRLLQDRRVVAGRDLRGESSFSSKHSDSNEWFN